jgi:nitrite reductase/ring-hydroxylating ferredoxin subunit
MPENQDRHPDDPQPGPAWVSVCPAVTLVDGGEGVRFDLAPQSAEQPQIAAFVVRHKGHAFAYVNQCAHVPVELDWQPGRFFDDEGEHLICATHGATYRPHDGVCIAGPCRGRRLQSLDCQEHAGQIWVRFRGS